MAVEAIADLFTHGSFKQQRATLLMVNLMLQVFEWVMLSRPDLDSHRFRETLEEAIEKGKNAGHGCSKMVNLCLKFSHCMQI
jgi:hypothetical protein